MNSAFEHAYRKVRDWAELHGISVREARLPRGKAGEFDGLSVTMNSLYDPDELTYYLVHALGSIVLWARDPGAVQAMFHELRASKEVKQSDPVRLDRAIERYRVFEVESSERGFWLLGQLGCPDVIPSYINFMRADLEALTEFHRLGRAPVWRDFFAAWNEQVARGLKQVEPFRPKAIPAFTPVPIERQEILQEQG